MATVIVHDDGAVKIAEQRGHPMAFAGWRVLKPGFIVTGKTPEASDMSFTRFAITIVIDQGIKNRVVEMNDVALQQGNGSRVSKWLKKLTEADQPTAQCAARNGDTQ